MAESGILLKQSSLENSQTAEPIQIIVPVYNEGENASTLYQRLVSDKVTFNRLGFVYDLDSDNTLPVIARLREHDERVFADKNQLPRGVVNALTWAFKNVSPGPVIVVMGDNSDKLEIIPEMIRLWQDGATVVSPSRYLKGGVIQGDSPLKKVLRWCGVKSLTLFGFPVTDPTNNFKLYDGAWLAAQKIESIGGFEIAFELCLKAYAQGRHIAELPTTWTDRTLGQSNFKLWKWVPHYLRWYFKAIGQVIGKKFAKSF
jgi:glycosyltransferase involved in cell wall biosynthesis